MLSCRRMCVCVCSHSSEVRLVVEPRTNRNYTLYIFIFMTVCVNSLTRVFVNDNHIEAENKLCHWVRVTEKLSIFFSLSLYAVNWHCAAARSSNKAVRVGFLIRVKYHHRERHDSKPTTSIIITSHRAVILFCFTLLIYFWSFTPCVKFNSIATHCTSPLQSVAPIRRASSS